MSTAPHRSQAGPPPDAAGPQQPPAPTARPGHDVRFAVVALAFVVVTVVSLLVVNIGARETIAAPAPEELGWFEAWVRYDAGWYYSIATDGYFFTPDQQSSVAFFPTYPLLMALLGPALGFTLTGVIVTLAAGLTSVLLLARWCAGRVPRSATWTAVALLLLYPYSLYLYGAVYSDALFLACALGAFLLLDNGRPALAGLVAIAATAGRPVGIAVIIGLAIRVLELAHQRAVEVRAHGGARQRSWRGRRDAVRLAVHQLRPRDAGVLLSVVGLGGYMVYQWVTFGTPIAFVLTESAPGWDQGTGPEVLFKLSFIDVLLTGSPLAIARLVLPAVLCVGALFLLPRVLRRFGWGYAAYTAVIVAIPVVATKDFMGGGRYLLVAFPLFVVLAEFLVDSVPRAVRIVVLASSAMLLGVLTAVYGYGLQVS